MGFIPIVALVLIGVGVAAAVAGAQRSAQLAAWRRAADTLGLTVRPGSLTQPMVMSGTVEGFAAEVRVHRQSTGKSSQVFTDYKISYPRLGLGLRLARESGYTKLVRVFGAQDHQIGDEPFDAAFEIKGADPAAVATFLTAGRREALLRLLASHPEVVVADSEVTLRRHGVERDADRLVSVTRRLAATAGTLTDQRLADRIRHKIEQRVAGDLAATATATVHPHPDDLDDALLHVEGLYGAGRRAEAASAAASLAAKLPSDPDVAGLHAQTSAAPSKRAASTASTDPVEVATVLFGENRLSFETTRLFEERFAGTPVTWRGVVRRATDVTDDRDFGAGSITKAVIRVATIANDLYGQAEVDAVVAFPPGTRLTEGAEVSFTGELVNVDGLIRNLFVADGAMGR